MYCTWCFGWDSKIKFMKNLDNSQILKWQDPGFANCMKFSWRETTTSRPFITQSLWGEINTQYLHDIPSSIQIYNTSDELVLNAYQTPSKYVPTTNVTMANSNSYSKFKWQGTTFSDCLYWKNWKMSSWKC